MTPRSLFVCGKTVAIFGWSTARTIGSTSGRICFSGTESRLPRLMPSRLGRPSTAASGPNAMSAVRSTSISPQKCSDSSKTLPRHSLHIHYFVMKKLACSPRWVSLFELISGIRRCSSILPATVQPSFSTLHCKTLNNFSKVCYSLPCLPSPNND